MAAPIEKKAPEIANAASREAAAGKAGRLKRLSFSRKKGLLDAMQGPVQKEKKEEIAAAGKSPEAAAEESTDAPAAKTSFLGLVKYALGLFNPVKLCRRFRKDLEDYRAAKREDRGLREETLLGKPERIRSMIDLKLGGALAGSEMAGIYIIGPLVGGAVQIATGNAYWGILGTVVGGYLPAIASFQAIWLGLNLKYYSNCADTFWGKARQFYKDVLPLHGAAMIATIPADAVSSALSVAAVAAINAISPGLANSLPIPLIALASIAVGEAVFLTLVGNMLPGRLIDRIADAYHSYLKRRYCQ
ncbi:MAG: hypothetical protein AB1657_02670 [Candidatus Micrarchaeota archaeon]